MNIENLTKLRDFLRDKVSDARFNIKHMVTGPDGRAVLGEETAPRQLKTCGTAACVAGWTNFLLAPRTKNHDSVHAAARLGLDAEGERRLFMPRGFEIYPERFTRARAVETLTRLIETGEVDWGPEP